MKLLDILEVLDDIDQAWKDAGRLRLINETQEEMAAYFRLQGELFMEKFSSFQNLFREAADDSDILGAFDDVAAETNAKGNKIIQDSLKSGANLGYKNLSTDFGVDVAYKLSNERAVDYATRKAAIDVTNINNTTRETIHNIVTTGIDEGKSYSKVAREIKGRFGQFAIGKPQEHIRSRAELVAVTENAFAYEDGQRMLVDDVTAAGVDMEKKWSGPYDARTSAGCINNMAQGWIPAKELFASGHDTPPRFPGCRHHTQYRVAREEEPITPKAPSVPKQITPEQWAKGLSEEELNSIQAGWQSSGVLCDQLRELQKTGTIKGFLPENIAGIRKTREALSKIWAGAPNYKGTVYRGMYNLNDDVAKAFTQSKTITIDAMSSASTDLSVAEKFAMPGGVPSAISKALRKATGKSNMLLEVRTKTGTRINGASLGRFVDEKEVVLQANTKYRVLQTAEEEDYIRVVLEEI